MSWDTSLAIVLPYKPWRYTTPPTYDGSGNVTDPGVTQQLNGVFILLSERLVALLKEELTQAEKNELDGYVNRYSSEQCAEWHVPVWAGEDSAVYCRVPAAVWSDPETQPPAKVRKFFRRLWRSVS